MDDRDFHLLAELVREPLASYATLGRRIGLAASSVRGRVARLQDQGVLRGFQLLPGAPALGRARELWRYPASRVTPDLSSVLAVDDVVVAVEWHDRSWSVFAYRAEGVRGPLRALDEIFGVGGAVTRFGPSDDDLAPARPTVLSRPDWRLVQALLEDPRAPAEALARRCGQSPKRVRTRRRSLLEHRVLQIVPHVDYAKFRGSVIFGLSVFFRAPLSSQTLEALVPEGVLVRYNDHPPSAFYVCSAASVPAVAEVERRVGATAQVREAEAGFERARGFAADRVRGWVADQIARWEAPRSVGRRNSGRAT